MKASCEYIDELGRISGRTFKVVGFVLNRSLGRAFRGGVGFKIAALGGVTGCEYIDELGRISGKMLSTFKLVID